MQDRGRGLTSASANDDLKDRMRLFALGRVLNGGPRLIAH